MGQLRNPVTIPRREKISYAIRFIFCLLTMESILHTMYVVAIKDASAWYGDGPGDLSMIGFWNLVVVWLKVSVPFTVFSRKPLKRSADNCVAVDTLAFLPPLGTYGRHGPSGEYDSLCCE